MDAGPDQWSSGTKYLPWSFHATFNKAASTSSRQMELKRICSCMFCHFYLDVVQRSSSSWCHNSQCCGQTSTFIVENCVNIFCSWERTETTRKFGLWHETSFYKVEPAPPIPIYKSAAVRWLCSFYFAAETLLVLQNYNICAEFMAYKIWSKFLWLGSIMFEGGVCIGQVGDAKS